MRRLVLALTALLALAAVAQLTLAELTLAQAQDAATLKRGAALLKRQCGACHAVGRADRSPLALAMPFREIDRHYRVESLEEALAEGLISGHPDMPEFRFEADDVGAIIAYLKSIQTR